MIKKTIIVVVCLLSLQKALSASPILLKGTLAYFRPTSSILRDIYGSSWLNSGFEVSGKLPFNKPFIENLYVFGGFNYLDASGHSLGGHDRTEIRIIPLSLGLNYMYTFFEGSRPLKIYLGGGLSYFFVRVKNDVSFVKRRVTKNGFGGIVNGGVHYFLKDFFFLNGFINYSFRSFGIIDTRKGVSGKGVAVGGLSIGGGIGFQF